VDPCKDPLTWVHRYF